MSDVTETVAGRYEALRPLGRGAFGHTYAARDRESGRDVALKRLDPRAGDEWKARELFEREASVLQALDHPGVPKMHAIEQGEWQGVPARFLVMELVEGATLAERIDAGHPLDPSEVRCLFVALLDVLDYLHSRVPPVLHRDVKPSNVIVRADGSPVLVDFGAVGHVSGEGGSTVAGTYGYMPYEQYMGQATPASDLYALGATFLHLVTGRPPRDFMDADGRIAVPASLPGDPALAAVLARLLRPSPAERFASARAAREALDASAVATHPPHAASSLVHGDATRVLALATPRPDDAVTRALLDRTSYSGWELMDTSAKPGDKHGLLAWASFALFSALTAGVMPLVFFGIARARRQRLRRFLRDGVPAVGEVVAIDSEPTAFGERIARVTYEWVADGERHRDADRVLPTIAQRWRPGDRVQLLYLPDAGYESVILATP